MNKITRWDAVYALKAIGLSSTAASIASRLKTSSRAVATALRTGGATTDGRVSTTFRKGRCWYRFVRLTPKELTK